jgi:hypothetical protein
MPKQTRVLRGKNFRKVIVSGIIFSNHYVFYAILFDRVPQASILYLHLRLILNREQMLLHEDKFYSSLRIRIYGTTGARQQPAPRIAGAARHSYLSHFILIDI